MGLNLVYLVTVSFIMQNNYNFLMPRTNASRLHDERNSLLCRGFNIMVQEIFYPLNCFNLEGKYEISNLQRIRTVIVRNRWGWYKPKKERIIKQYWSHLTKQLKRN